MTEGIETRNRFKVKIVELLSCAKHTSMHNITWDTKLKYSRDSLKMGGICLKLGSAILRKFQKFVIVSFRMAIK